MPDPAELLAVARLLVDETRSPASDAQRRRAVSTAYYALFHKISGEAASRLVGPVREHRAAYRLIYRSFEHTKIKDICSKLAVPRLSKTLRRQLGVEAVSKDMREFAFAFPDIQDARHDADYDPMASFTVAEVLALIQSVEEAIAAFDRAAAEEQVDVLALMLMKPRA